MKVGSLCTGIGGLDLAVEQTYGAELAWFSEIEPAPCEIIERNWPGVPNLGNLTTVDWSTVPKVDILTAGYPCQPFSHAGNRQGHADERHIWPWIIDAIRVLRPGRVVLENVAGHLSLGFGTVLGDLAEAGFDAEWCVLRASDVGACHRRERVFIVATDAHAGARESHAATATDSGGERHGGRQDGRTLGRLDGRDAGEARQRQRTWPVPVDRSGKTSPDPAGTERRTSEYDCVGEAVGPATEPRERLGESAVRGETSPDSSDFGHERAGTTRHRRNGSTDSSAVDWGQYRPAIDLWATVLGRPAPPPTDDRGRLEPRFVEWMMGYPEGWVDGLTRTQALKALGNAVVPQQGVAALVWLGGSGSVAPDDYRADLEWRVSPALLGSVPVVAHQVETPPPTEVALQDREEPAPVTQDLSR